MRFWMRPSRSWVRSKRTGGVLTRTRVRALGMRGLYIETATSSVEQGSRRLQTASAVVAGVIHRRAHRVGGHQAGGKRVKQAPLGRRVERPESQPQGMLVRGHDQRHAIMDGFDQ